MKYFIANWKARIGMNEVTDWSTEFINKLNCDEKLRNKLLENEVQIIICPPYPYICLLKDVFRDFPNIHLGSQDISPFDEGTYTGEVTAKMLQGLIHYAIIGHSERRHFFNENEEIISKKIDQASAYGIEPVLCLRGSGDKIHPPVKMITYEPVGAIWPGKNEDPTKVVDTKTQLTLPPQAVFIYGGSVDAANIRSYMDTNEIDGFLIGNASLDPVSFYQTISVGL